MLLSLGKLSAQGIVFKIHTTPSNADVFLNNIRIGYTPYAQEVKLNFKKYFRYELRISKPGYKDTSYFYTEDILKQLERKTSGRNDELISSDYIDIIKINIKLKREPNIFDSVKNIVLGFDKMIFDIKEGTNIGEGKLRGPFGKIKVPLTWNPSEYSTLKFNKIAEDFLDSVGFDIRKTTALFSEDKIEKGPDLLLGASLIEYLCIIPINWQKHIWMLA